ncbi:uncharacterized protein LOC117321633 isoform X2 [Pecten maximus]|uniref:uncharacterized protein LOC117321633 isoform X2 n=1 Tax=Pecten maximus TaxID=6579 RepID=UPI001458F345|nr:uncharacterized protein LOC117321633 isoform X2 [Pecten maximus]
MRIINREDLIACIKPGKYVSMGIFIATFGGVYAVQQTYMYNTKRFMKYKNRMLLPLGTALVASYGYFISVFLNCRREVMKDYPQLIKNKNQSKTTKPQSNEFDDNDETSNTWKE